MCLTRKWSHTVACHFIYMPVLLSNPLSPSSQFLLILAFLTVQEEEDMVSAFSLPSPWKQSCSMTGFGLLGRTLSPHETCYMPAAKPSWLELRKSCFCTDAGYRGSSRHMLVGKKEQLWGLWFLKNSIQNLNRQQRLGIGPPRHCWGFGLSPHLLSFFVPLCNFKGHYFDFVLWLCVITQIPNEVRTSSFKFQTPHKGICLAQAQNPITTAVIDVLWYLIRHSGISFQGSWDWCV